MVEFGSDREQPCRDDGALIVDFAERYGAWAVIAQGSEGVGASVARLLGDRGVNGVARREAVKLMSQGAAALRD